MKCSECTSQGLKSKVFPGAGMTTAMYCPPFFDEDGKYHNHDANITDVSYSCSNGHTWSSTIRNSCWCGWGKENTQEGTNV